MLNIRRARLADIQAVADLYHAVWHETHARFMPKEEIARRDLMFFVDRMSSLVTSCLVVERQNSILAFSSWTGALLGQIWVACGHRDEGIGAELMMRTELAMATEGIHRAELHCVVGNTNARRFYERLGWSVEEEMLDRVAGPEGPVDATFWRMCKSLDTCSGDDSDRG